MNEGIVLKRPIARFDLAACYAYIGERNPDAAHRFRLAAEAMMVALAASPGIGALYEVDHPRLGGLRCGQVKRFRNDLIFYLTIEGGIEVIRVLHAARNVRAILEYEHG